MRRPTTSQRPDWTGQRAALPAAAPQHPYEIADDPPTAQQAHAAGWQPVVGRRAPHGQAIADGTQPMPPSRNGAAQGVTAAPGQQPVSPRYANNPDAMLQAILSQLHPVDAEALMDMVQATIDDNFQKSQDEPVEGWGVGNAATTTPAHAMALITEGIILGDKNNTYPVELIAGDNPHTRDDNNEYARFRDGTTLPFGGKSVLYSLILDDTNHISEKDDPARDAVRGWTRGLLYINGNPAFEVGGSDMTEAMLDAQVILRDLDRVQYYTEAIAAGQPQLLLGRPVYYKGVPATISQIIPDQGCVVLIPDSQSNIAEFPADTWEYENPEEVTEDDINERRAAKVDVLSKDIDWVRTKAFPASGPGDPFSHLRPAPVESGVIQGRTSRF